MYIRNKVLEGKWHGGFISNVGKLAVHTVRERVCLTSESVKSFKVLKEDQKINYCYYVVEIHWVDGEVSLLEIDESRLIKLQELPGIQQKK